MVDTIHFGVLYHIFVNTKCGVTLSVHSSVYHVLYSRVSGLFLSYQNGPQFSSKTLYFELLLQCLYLFEQFSDWDAFAPRKNRQHCIDTLKRFQTTIRGGIYLI